MTVHFITRAFRKDLARALEDRVALALYLGLPLVIGFMILMLMGSDRPEPVARLLVADEDNTVASGLFKTMLRSEQAGEFIRMEETNRADGRAVIDDGDASALLVIPAGFQDAVLRETPAQLELVTNPAETIKPMILSTGLEVLVDGTFYLHRILGNELRAIVRSMDRDEPPTDEAITEISVGVNRVVHKLEKYLSPPAIVVKAVAEEDDSRAGVPMAHLMLPGIILMGLFLMAQGLGSDIWSEKAAGTLSRMVSAPRPMESLLMGKLLADAVLVFAVSLVLLIIGMLFLDIPFARLPVALAWTTLSGVTFVLLFMSVFVHARSRRSGMVISNCILFPLLMLGGSFFPAETMPTWMGAIGRFTPNGWSLEHLKDILLDRGDATALFIGAAMLLALAFVLFFHTASRMHGSFARR